MSPKKGVRSNRKNNEKIRSVRKVKSHSNNPANLKVSIPMQSTEQEGVYVPIIKGRRPPRYTKHLNIQTKVDLANSVARHQLVKEEPPVFQMDNVVIINAPKGRGRKKKVTVVSDFFQNENLKDKSADTTLADTNTVLPEKPAQVKKKPTPTRKILTRKRLADTKVQKDPKRPKVEPTPVINPLDTKIKIEDNGQTADVPDDSSSDLFVEPQAMVAQLVVQPASKMDQPKPKKTKPIAKRVPPAVKKPPTVKQPTSGRKRGSKGKQQTVEAPVQTPPTINLLINKVTEAEVKTTENKINVPGLVESRKNSVGSSSNKSWTRDISSSSNNTCVGSVCSNDFVRINKKLPVLKLTNIDSELKRRLSQALEMTAPAVVEETSEDLSDSYDSDSSDSEQKYSEQLNDSLGAHSLHLSVSSSSQFTQSRGKEHTSDNANERCSDYATAANKLSLTMEKLDMEIIKWMNSENEDVNANLVKFRDKMYGILDREFGVITHCRQLKEMLNPTAQKDSIDETSISKQVPECGTHNDRENAQIKENAPAEENVLVGDTTRVKKNTSVQKKSPVPKNTSVQNKSPVQKNISVQNNSPVQKSTPVEIHTKDIAKEFVKPGRRPSRHLSSTSEGNISNASTKASKDVTSDDEMAAGTSNSYPHYDYHDDDDTLSLFAESISGFESSRMTTTSVVVSKHQPAEEYIPKPVNEDYVPNTEKHAYCPTKIREDVEPTPTASKVITVCEKQNADSTSIFKQSNSTDDAESYQDFTEDIDADSRLGPPDMIKKPRLMESYYDGGPKARSVVFGNLCFYNLMNCCRKPFQGQCRFVHLIPPSAQIKEKLNHLDERMLIQEYLLIKNWSELRRRYGLCYVEECAQRGLTRILVEIAYDFIVKARSDSEADTRLRVDTIEVTLLHLNSVDLSICEDLLKLPVHSEQTNRTLLCDVFMATMSITQNFSRFKIVFLTLTYFMVDNDRTFNKDVVEHILERLCIFPFEEPIARALIQMMRLTNSDIFYNSMIGHFEKQISVNKDVFDEYMLLKSQCALSSMLASSVMSGSPPLDAPPPDADPQPPTASPDTTNLDKMQNKTTKEPTQPVITRTIGMNPPIIFNRAATSPVDSRAHISPRPSQTYDNRKPALALDSSEDSVKLNIRQWRNRSVFPHLLPPAMANRGSPRGMSIRGTPTRGTMRPPMQRSPFNQRLVTFKTPSNYAPRRPGPKY